MNKKRLYVSRVSTVSPCLQALMPSLLLLSAPRLRCLNCLNKGFGGQLPESHSTAPDALLGAEVIRSRYQDAIFTRLHTNGGHSEAQRLHPIDLPVGNLWQQVDKALILVAHNRHTRRIFTRVLHVVVNHNLSPGDKLPQNIEEHLAGAFLPQS